MMRNNRRINLFLCVLFCTGVINFCLAFFYNKGVTQDNQFIKNIYMTLSQGEIIVGIGVALPTFLLWKSELDNRKSDRQVSNFEYSFQITKELQQAHDRCKKQVTSQLNSRNKAKLRKMILSVREYIELLEQIQGYKNKDLIITTISNSDIYEALTNIQKNNAEGNDRLVVEIGGLLTRILVYDKNDSKLKDGDPIQGIYFLFDSDSYFNLDFGKIFSSGKFGKNNDNEDLVFIFRPGSKFIKCTIDLKSFSKYARHDEEGRDNPPKFKECNYYYGRGKEVPANKIKEKWLSGIDEFYSDAIKGGNNGIY
ncbi:hypothetical protein D3X11_06235 [Streptococcus sp. X16XC17]|nr:hypothetical protein D3X11_06235 [Streptococcus sp. X16XC17]